MPFSAHFLLPETYSHKLLTRKAERLRALTGNASIVSRGELLNRKLTAREMAKDILWRPIEITLMEPVVLLINIYLALVQSIVYLWFEAFPIVFVEIYRFNLIEMGVSYVGLTIGVIVGGSFYIPFIYRRYTKVVIQGGQVYPELFIPVAIVGSIMMPIGIFIFGWTASEHIHWVFPIIGTAIFAFGMFLVFQGLFNYLGMSFWRYMASVFASNDLFRSLTAGAFPLFGHPLFSNLGPKKFPVGWGSSILAFIALAMVAVPVVFYINGPKLRARSKYTSEEDW